MQNAETAEAQKRHMLSVLEKEGERFQQALNDYQALRVPNKAAYLRVSAQLIESVNKIEAAGDWQASLFLRNTIKPLLAVREEAQAVQKALVREEAVETATKTLTQNEQKVFITVYQSKGQNLALWETQLRSLSSYVQGRPIYANEDDIRRALRAKLDQTNEAYVIVVIDRCSVMQNTQRTDRYGHPLLTLLPGAIETDNIIGFVHQGKQYEFVAGQLQVKV